MLAAITSKQSDLLEGSTNIQMIVVMAGIMLTMLVAHEIMRYIAARLLGFEAAFVVARIPGVPLVKPAVGPNTRGAFPWQWRIVFVARQLLTAALLLFAIACAS